MADPDKARLRSIHEVKRRLVVNALPVIGNVGLAKLTKRDVRDVTDRIMKRGARTQAWHTHKDLSALLRWAVRHDYLTHNPIEGVPSPGGFTAGDRTLSDARLPRSGMCCRPRSPSRKPASASSSCVSSPASVSARWQA